MTGNVEKYPSGRRGSPAKGVVWETAARVQIPPSPPNLHRNLKDTVHFFVVSNAGFFIWRLTHLIICSLCTFPIAYFMRWMNHSVFGILSYFGVFFAIYFIIWMSQYMAIKKRIQQKNSKVQKKNHMDMEKVFAGNSNSQGEDVGRKRP